jgi:hypothetical protein
MNYFNKALDQFSTSMYPLPSPVLTVVWIHCTM